MGVADVELGAILTSRSDRVEVNGEIPTLPTVAKISFADGEIQFRGDGASKTKMIRIEPGDLVVSGINAYKGAIGIYDPVAESSALATIHYSAYAVDEEKADRRYLWYMLRS